MVRISRHKVSIFLTALLFAAVLLSACEKASPSGTSPAEASTEAAGAKTESAGQEETGGTGAAGSGSAGSGAEESAEETEPESTEAPKPTGPEPQRRVTAYFGNWYVYEGNGAGDGEVAGLPWDRVTAINHAFWKVAPTGEDKRSSFARRDSGRGPRSEFGLVPCDEYADLKNPSPSEKLPGVTKAHFAQYPIMAEQHPDVQIMLSIGGWNDSEYFSEMAYTKEGRASFIKSCLNVLSEYWWLDGIDIDWEFIAGGSGGERKASSSGNGGCPIWGTKEEDRQNFTKLIMELREALDARYGEGVIPLTAAASASAKYILPNEDWVSPAPYLNRINVMSYDMTGSYDGITGHVASLKHVREAYEYLTGQGIRASRLYMGTQLYGKAFYLEGEIDPHHTVGVKCSKKNLGEAEKLRQYLLTKFESEAVSGYYTKKENGRTVMDGHFDYGGVGWHFDYDETEGGAYMYNDDPSSEYYRWWISYENALSIQAKLDFCENHGMYGMIVWSSNQDTYDYKRLEEIRYSPAGT